MSFLFIKASPQRGGYLVDLKTYIIISVYKMSQPPNLKLKVRVVEEAPRASIGITLEGMDFEVVSGPLGLAEWGKWPVILRDKYVVSGMCSVARQMCKMTNKAEVRKLLGFREACLVACAESSVWTKFCEIDITDAVNGVLNGTFMEISCFHLPPDVLRYENHLSQPVRIHNIYKIARDSNKDPGLKSSTPRRDLGIAHDFAEGPYVTLADLILFPCFQAFFQYTEALGLEFEVPLIRDWFNRVALLNLQTMGFDLNMPQYSKDYTIIIPEINNVSLYNADPTRALPVKHTKQYKIESALSLIDTFKEKIVNDFLPFGHEICFDWGSIPLGASPLGGALPAKRATRKCEQLENLVKATLAVVGDERYRIVDFCSGSGHLGILIALLLPHCEVILVENKEMSLTRARDTILKLNLKNIVVVQSNLDYFIGGFDLGLALHACGVATDLVLQMCIKNKADFICCPCCYGGIKNCHEVTYPRSLEFQSVFNNSEDQYFNLAHAADQTHEEGNSKTKQGYFCMDIIDSDRKWYAEGCGYKVRLGKLQPVACTNKNNLLVGIYGKDV